MKNSSAQLSERLSKNLFPVYIISGDEILLVEEAFDLVCKAAKRQGFQERITFEPKLNIGYFKKFFYKSYYFKIAASF